MQYDCWSTTVECSLFVIINASYTNTEILESSLVGFGVNWLLHKISFHRTILFGHVTALDTLRFRDFFPTDPWDYYRIEKSSFVQNEMTILTQNQFLLANMKFADFLLWNKLEGHIMCYLCDTQAWQTLGWVISWMG